MTRAGSGGVYYDDPLIYDWLLKNYIPIPPAIGKEEHRGILTGSSDPDGGADYPERAITSVIDDFEAIGKRLKEIQAEKDREKAGMLIYDDPLLLETVIRWTDSPAESLIDK